KIWDSVKKEEKKGKEFKHILDKIPYTYSPLLRSYKLQKEASKQGFDWKDYVGPLGKIEEEFLELKEAIEKKEAEHIEHEIGDMIFALINLGRFFEIRGDVALTKCNRRFKKRFDFVEESVKKSGKKFKDFTLDELDEFWNEAKKGEQL
ncbi:MAG TPA: MazG nucleotide pyrophosphohydrolase domain-containing protein, partial [Spirochaetota bacterium]|nr:MazG nucleotide pyrophosphohydrolase domain-containing protein [Spirochaetota bacterium]